MAAFPDPSLNYDTEAILVNERTLSTDDPVQAGILNLTLAVRFLSQGLQDDLRRIQAKLDRLEANQARRG